MQWYLHTSDILVVRMQEVQQQHRTLNTMVDQGQTTHLTAVLCWFPPTCSVLCSSAYSQCITTRSFSVTHTHTYRFLSGCKEVENCTSQLAEPHNFPCPRNTTLLHEFDLTTTQILEYTPTQFLPTHLPHGLVR